MAGPPGAGPGGPPPGGQIQPPQVRPGNEGLINRVLGLITGETERKKQQEHRAALQRAAAEGARAGQSHGVEGILGLLGGMGGLGGLGGGMGDLGGLGGGMGEMPPEGLGAGMGEPPQFAHGGVFSRGGGALGRARSYVPSHGPGDGDGRSDHVDAKLSPNEYIMDAETVALLGNGSPDAGARRLDAMRANVRKHKGGALSQGKFSADAKAPEAYLPKR